MKKIQQTLLLAFAIACLAGCASTPKEQAYETLSGVKFGVESGVRTAAILHSGGNITDNEWQNVKTLYDDEFVPNFQVAVDLAMQDYTQPVPKLVADISTKILTRVADYQRKNN